MLPGRAPEHVLGLLADGLDAAVHLVDGDDGRLVDDDALAPRVDAGVGRAEVDGQVTRKQREQRTQTHSVVLPFWAPPAEQDGPDAVAAVPLDPVHRLVGGADQVGGRIGRPGQRGHADRHGQAHLDSPPRQERLRRDALLDAAGHAAGIAPAGAGQHHHELVAAVPHRGIGQADAGPQQVPDFHERPAAQQVAVAVVDALERVEIQEHERERAAVRASRDSSRSTVWCRCRALYNPVRSSIAASSCSRSSAAPAPARGRPARARPATAPRRRRRRRAAAAPARRRSRRAPPLLLLGRGGPTRQRRRRDRCAARPHRAGAPVRLGAQRRVGDRQGGRSEARGRAAPGPTSSEPARARDRRAPRAASGSHSDSRSTRNRARAARCRRDAGGRAARRAAPRGTRAGAARRAAGGADQGPGSRRRYSGQAVAGRVCRRVTKRPLS